MKKIFAMLIFIATISSCEKDFIVKEQNTSKGMVINSLFTDAWTISVYLTSSYSSSGSNNIEAITGARVELYEDSIFKEVLTYVPSDTLSTFGSYQSQLVPHAGKKYFIKAIHPLYGIATAEDEIPMPAQIISHDLLQYPDTLNHLSDATLKFKFKDDGSTENYYRINAWVGGTYRYINPNGDTIESQYSEGLRPELLTTVSDTVRDNGWFILFSDKNFNGLQEELNLKFNNMPVSNDFSSLNIWVELYTVSKTNFEYHKTLDLYRHTNSNAEPVHVNSNVQNGYGIFAGADFQSIEYVVR